MRRFFSRYFYYGLILVVIAALYIANFQAGKYLLGWDSLQTELNPLLGVKRAFFGVWQEYQSFGLVAGMAHAADLLRALFLVPLTALLPNTQVRYTFHFLMLLVGSWGMFTLLCQSGLDKGKKLLASLGALFYVLNIAAIQIMALPFESFSIFLASLPWLVWVFLKFMENREPNKNSFLTLIIINLLATPSFVAQQLFVIYLLVLGFLFLGFLFSKPRLVLLKRFSLAILLILLLNSFWLLPQAYFLKAKGYVVREAKINQLMTEDIYYRNLEKGNPHDFLKLEGFFYTTTDAAGKSLFQIWQDHREQSGVQVIVWFFALLGVGGLLVKSKYRASFSLLYLFVALGLLINTPGFREINSVLRGNPLLNQIFRSPFTKLVVVLALVNAYFFTQFLQAACRFVTKFIPKIHQVWVYGFGASIVAMGLVIYSLPAFMGYYFAPEMRVAVPADYHEAISYFKQIDKNKRIALMPDYTYWGWFFTNWGYNGSGFLWYGIEQPIVSRNFDYWSNKSESYFWEVKKAVEAEDVLLLGQVLQKYDIDFLVLDKSLLPVSSTTKALQYDRIYDLFNQSPLIHRVKSWPNLVLYQVKSDRDQAFLSVQPVLPNIGPERKIMDYDRAYALNGNYLTQGTEVFTRYYPFSGLFSQTNINHPLFFLEEAPTNFVLSTSVFATENYQIIKPKEQNYAFQNQYSEVLKIDDFQATVSANLTRLTASFPKVLVAQPNISLADLKNCGDLSGELQHQVDWGGLNLFVNHGANFCFGYLEKYLDQSYGYLVKVTATNIQGRNLFFNITDDTKKQVYLETRLVSGDNYFYLNPRYKSGYGYSFNFSNDSYQAIVGENRLVGLEIYLLPYEEINGLSLIPKIAEVAGTGVIPELIKPQKKSYFQYETALSQNGEGTLVLSQAFDEGWVAYLNGRELEEHVLVNNWANGWLLPQDSASQGARINIIFWPQYLQFIGFALVALAFSVSLLLDLQKKEE